MCAVSFGIQYIITNQIFHLISDSYTDHVTNIYSVVNAHCYVKDCNGHKEYVYTNLC